MKKKILALIVLITIIFSSFSSVLALSTIYEKTNEEQLSSGAILKEYKVFTDKGWLSINIVEVDLEDENTKVGLLNSENGLNTFQTVYDMANKDNIIAAINGDFFNGTYKNGNTIGLSISDGELLTSTYYENKEKDTFGTLILDEDNNAWMDFFTEEMVLKAKRSGAEFKVNEYNKIALNSNYNNPVLYTKKWGEMSVGSTPDLILTEMVVEDGKVIEIRNNEGPVEIPKDGFVISVCGNVATYINDNFKKGTNVDLDIKMDLDIDKVKMAVSGGAILVQDGEIPEEFSSNITGSHPRTAIGLSEDSKTLYLITVDGRQKMSIGMTQTELAEFLVEKGIYSALNLDGGGSTTMVARKLGYNTISTINSPSGGTLRMVTNAIGVYNKEKKSTLSNIKLEIDEENVFVGCERKINVLGYDKNFNPVEIDFDDITWSYEGAKVTVKDGKIIAGEEAGTAKITAKKGKIETTVTVDVLSDPNELTISPKKSSIALEENVEFSIIAKNKNGYYASIKNEELNFEIVSGEGKFEGNKYIPKTSGEHIIKVSAGNAASYALVNVGGSNQELIDDFESETFLFVSYPEEVTGDVEKSSKEKFEGKYSAKLDYDFTKTDATRAAYLRFSEGIVIPEDATSINFNVYASNENEEYIKMKLVDAKGVTQLVMVNKEISSEKWTSMSYDLTSIALPATLTDIYVGQDNPEIKNKGTIYIDELILTKDIYIGESNIALPQDIKGEDELCKETELKSGDSLKILVYDQIKAPTILLDQLSNNKIKQVINTNAEVAIFTSQDDRSLTEEISTDIIYEGAYSKTDYENSTFITIDVSKGGLRNTDYMQWINLQEDIKNNSLKNIFILMNGTLEDFTDVEEKKLFIDVLCELRRSTSKNIWVITKGEKTVSAMERGIRYLTIGNEWIDQKSPIDVAQNTKYLMITVGKNEITYEVKNVFE